LWLCWVHTVKRMAVGRKERPCSTPGLAATCSLVPVNAPDAKGPGCQQQSGDHGKFLAVPQHLLLLQCLGVGGWVCPQEQQRALHQGLVQAAAYEVGRHGILQHADRAARHVLSATQIWQHADGVYDGSRACPNGCLMSLQAANTCS
jgi:hypothetical protein